MSAPMSANIPVSKKTFKFHVLGNITLLCTVLCLVCLPLNGNSSLDAVSNIVSASKVNSFLIILFHLTFQVILKNVSGSGTPYKFNVKDSIWTCVLCVAGLVAFHCIAVLFGAAFTENTEETFHFALVLTCTTIVPIFIHLGISSDIWAKVFALNSPEPGTETMVYIATICSVAGAWVGAFPIPLDWDRPWQMWPISCVLGALLGHCFGLLINNICICVHFHKTNKFKLV